MSRDHVNPAMSQCFRSNPHSSLIQHSPRTIPSADIPLCRRDFIFRSGIPAVHVRRILRPITVYVRMAVDPAKHLLRTGTTDNLSRPPDTFRLSHERYRPVPSAFGSSGNVQHIRPLPDLFQTISGKLPQFFPPQSGTPAHVDQIGVLFLGKSAVTHRSRSSTLDICPSPVRRNRMLRITVHNSVQLAQYSRFQLQRPRRQSTPLLIVQPFLDILPSVLNPFTLRIMFPQPVTKIIGVLPVRFIGAEAVYLILHGIIPLGFILTFPEGKHLLIPLPHLIFQRPGRPLFSLVLSMPHNNMTLYNAAGHSPPIITQIYAVFSAAFVQTNTIKAGKTPKARFIPESHAPLHHRFYRL